MSRDNSNGIRPPALGFDVLAALQLMCNHGLEGHRIQIVVHQDSDKFHGIEYRCANCFDSSSFLFVKSATQSIGVRNFLLAKGVDFEFKRAERKGRLAPLV